MSGTGRQSAQLRASDSWAAHGWGREQGHGGGVGEFSHVGGGMRGQRTREGKRGSTSCPTPRVEQA